MEKLIRCVIIIKEDIEDLIPISIPLNENDYLNQMVILSRRMNEQNEIFERNFATVVNLVVRNNGVICINGRDLDSDWNLYSNKITVKIPRDSIEVIKSHPKVQLIKEI